MILSNRQLYIITAIFFLAASLATMRPAHAADLQLADVYGVAIKGYDPVAYFTVGKAVKGKPAHAIEWNEATWHFSSEKHRDMFAANPQKYAPNHGGF
jgi:YHS domain-containing protein